MSMISKEIKKITTKTIQKKKGGELITMITAYDALFSKLFDGYVDIILVGDSLHMSFNGDQDTLTVSLEMMIYHTKAVCQSTQHSLVVLDMPFGTYMNKTEALQNAIRVYKETKAIAIKIEGGENKSSIIKHLTDNGISVMGHIGLLPQMVRSEGGYRVKGKNEVEKKQLIRDAKAVESAGAFCIVIEGVVAEVAAEVAKSVNVPLIGIGAGNQVDGQVLVWSDAFGFYESFRPKFAKQYMNGAQLIRDALSQYVQEVKSRQFPGEEYCY